MARGTGGDTLAAYLSRLVVTTLSTGTLTADIGWLLEKILETISLPDVLESPSEERIIVVNFEKRRYVLSPSRLETFLTHSHIEPYIRCSPTQQAPRVGGSADARPTAGSSSG